MKFKFNSLSIYQRQVILTVTATALCLLCASSLLFFSSLTDYRSSLENYIRGKVDIISASSSSALLFNDASSAKIILDSLNSDPVIDYALLLDNRMQAFAEFKRSAERQSIDAHRVVIGQRYTDTHLQVFRPIRFDGETVGHLYIDASIRPIVAQRNRFLMIAGATLLASIVLSLLIACYAHRRIAQPIKKLVETTQHITKHSDFSQRIEAHNCDDVGVLVNSFNQMLETLQERDTELNNHRQHLQELVAERTAQLHHRAHYDQLTQLPNRHLLTERIQRLVSDRRSDAQDFSLLFLDLDRFKLVNDNLGHAIGDQLLAQVAQRLKTALRTRDTVCRWGGDEFVVLLEGTQQQDIVAAMAEKIIDCFKTPIQLDEHTLHMTTSIGISRYPCDARNVEGLLKFADISMYQAKAQGVGHYCFYQAKMDQKISRQLSIENQLRSALVKGEFSVVYQPQVDSRHGQVVGFEALLRWHNDELGQVEPDEFIAIAEEIDLIEQLDLWLMARACTQACELIKAGTPFKSMAVNLSGRNFNNPSLVHKVNQILERSGLPAHYLEIELTESSLMQTQAPILERLQQLKHLGVRIAVDDFGTGFSSLRYLKDFPVDTLKIDGAFLEELGQGKDNDGIVSALISLGHNLRMEVVAEKVEDPQQANFLSQRFCDRSQGYYYSPPLDRNALKYYLDEQVILSKIKAQQATLASANIELSDSP